MGLAEKGGQKPRCFRWASQAVGSGTMRISRSAVSSGDRAPRFAPESCEVASLASPLESRLFND